MLAAAQPPWSADVLAWFALAPLLFALDGKRAWRRLALGLWCGTLWSAALVGVWLRPALGAALPVGPLGAAALAFGAMQVFGGLYLTLFAWLCRPALVRRRWWGVLAAASLWVAVEHLRARGFGGIAWGLLGHTQWRRATLIQIADVGGVAALSFLLAASSAALFAAAAALRQRRAVGPPLRACLPALLALAAALAYGRWQLERPAAATDDVAVQVVHSAWERDDDASGLLRHMVEITSRRESDGARLTVWPENSLRFYVQRSPENLAAIATLVRERDQYLLAGGPRYRRTFAGTWYYNSAHLIAPDGRLQGVRDKRLLVPLAESRLGDLPAVERPFRRGRPWRPILVGDVSVGVLICFEAIFPEPARRLVRYGAAALVNLTNDQLVGAGAHQQAAMAIFRAVENRVPLIRVANLGPTLVVDRFGRVVEERSGDGSFTARLAVGPAAPTFYQRFGEAFAYACLIPALWIAILRDRKAN